MNGSVAKKREVAPAGQYNRRPAFHMDVLRADHATVAAMSEYLRSVTQAYGAIEITHLTEAKLCGQGAVVTCGDELIRETVLEFLARSQTPEGLTAFRDGFGISAPLTKRIEQPCILAKRPWFKNFGHFLIDAGALLALLAEDCRREGLTIVLGDVGDTPMKQVMLDAVTQMLPGCAVLFHPDHETWIFRDLRYVTPVHVPPLFKLPAAASAMRDMLVPHWDAITPEHKLFVMRGTKPHLRALCNGNEIMQHCIRRGYRVLDPETLSIKDAAGVFARAKAVIGVKGAALTSGLFCRPGAVVMALSPADFPDPFFWDLCAQRDIAYGEVFGPVTTARPQSQNDFVIEPARLDRMLDAAEAAMTERTPSPA